MKDVLAFAKGSSDRYCDNLNLSTFVKKLEANKTHIIDKDGKMVMLVDLVVSFYEGVQQSYFARSNNEET